MTGYVLCDENRCLCKGMRGSFFPCLLLTHPCVGRVEVACLTRFRIYEAYFRLGFGCMWRFYRAVPCRRPRLMNGVYCNGCDGTRNVSFNKLSKSSRPLDGCCRARIGLRDKWEGSELPTAEARTCCGCLDSDRGWQTCLDPILPIYQV